MDDTTVDRELVEERLDELRREALPAPRPAPPAARPVQGSAPGYHGLPILKKPVWKWQIALYFFVGGLAGMSGMIAAGALLDRDVALVRVAMWAAGIGALVSPALLIWDLGRPKRFLHMLRVLKLQSPMSVGTWCLTAFGVFAVPGAVFAEWDWRQHAAGHVLGWVHVLSHVCAIGAGSFGVLVGTYTGALIATTVIPAWNLHRQVLPFHFGMAGLGSAASVAMIFGQGQPALPVLTWVAAVGETLVLVWLEVNRHGAADRALHEGRSGWTVRIGELAEGPTTMVLLGVGQPVAAAVCFLAGALVTRFGWLAAGRACALDPQALVDAQLDVPESWETSSAHPPLLAYQQEP